MKFLVDAHLPPGLCGVLQSDGHDAVHTRNLPTQNRTPDEVINELSLREQRVEVTKDSDFYHSHLLHGKPWKLLLVRTGNIRTGGSSLFSVESEHETSRRRGLPLPFGRGEKPRAAAARDLGPGTSRL